MVDVSDLPKDAQSLGAKIRGVWREHPSIMVKELFGATPDNWQEEALESYASNPRLAMKSCKGPGKTTTLSWIGWNFLLTRPHPKIAATSISGDNLQDGLWSEMQKWRAKAPLLQHMFEWTKTRIFAKEAPETWFMSARSWSQSATPEQQAQTLAGLHADYILFLLDESGGMPDALLPTAEAVLAGTKEGHIVQAGNPTQLAGPLYRACRLARALWKIIEITGDPDNPKRSARIPIEYARQQIEQYGRDSAWVLVNIFGEFPPSSLNALIGPDEVREAMKRYYREHEIGIAAKIMGVDIAREGLDHSSIAFRHGIQMFPFKQYRIEDSNLGASTVAREWDEFDADACFIDMTGGYGTGWYDNLRRLGRSPIGVKYSSDAHQKERFYNKRAEMAFEFVDWIKNGGALPESKGLLDALVNTTYTFKNDRLILEPKEDIKLKIGHSPDEMDSAMQTFADPIVPRAAKRKFISHSAVPAGYDPFGSFNSGNSDFDYNPWR